MNLALTEIPKTGFVATRPICDELLTNMGSFINLKVVENFSKIYFIQIFFSDTQRKRRRYTFMKRRNVTNQSPGGKSNNSAKNSNNSANLASRLSKQLSNSDTASEVEKPGKTKKKKKRKSNKKKESVGSPSSDETSMYLFF